MYPTNPKSTLEEGLKLTEEEAEILANEVKLLIRSGSIQETNTKEIQLMVAGLGDKRGLLRRTFAEALGLVGTAATPLLTEALLKSSNVIARRGAAKALKLVGDPTALPHLLKALTEDSDPVVQGSSAGAMAVFGETAVEYFLKVFMITNTTAMQSGLARWGLAFIGAQAAEALRNASQSKNALVRAAAIGALGDQIQNSNDSEAKDILLNALEDPSSDVRVEATALIGKLHESVCAEPHLLKQLLDPSPEVKKAAAISLMKLKSKTSIQILEEIKEKEKDLSVLNVVNIAIKILTKE